MPHVLTFGHTKGGNRKLWVERFKQLGPMARDHGVTIVVKQHGGETGTGAACAEIVREVGDEGIKVNYDAGNVMDYLDVDPIPDLRACADEVRSFCIKDHRNFPKDEDCGPGFGEIDHYKLLHLVAFTGRDMPLCCENIFAPLIPRPDESRRDRRPGPPGPRVPRSGDARLAVLIQYIRSNFQRGPSQDMTTFWRRSWPTRMLTPTEAGVVSTASTSNQEPCCHHALLC